MKNKDNESQEMYLETILILKKELPVVRSVDVAERLGYAKSSVSRAVNSLHDSGLIAVSDEGYITLTTEGEKKAEAVYERHNILTEFFVSLGADAALAESNACRIEHVIDDTIFELIKNKLGK